MGQSIDFDLFQPAKQFIIHLAHDITEQKRQDELVRQVLALSKELCSFGEREGRAAPVQPLSAQEIQILKMFASGGSPSETAKNLAITPQTLVTTCTT